MVDGHAKSVRLRKPVHERLATVSLIALSIGNNTTADSATVSIYRNSTDVCVKAALMRLQLLVNRCMRWKYEQTVVMQ